MNEAWKCKKCGAAFVADNPQVARDRMAHHVENHRMLSVELNESDEVNWLHEKLARTQLALRGSEARLAAVIALCDATHGADARLYVAHIRAAATGTPA